MVAILCRGIKVSIHAPWEGCDFTWVRMLSTQAVSIHAPWEGCDLHGQILLLLLMKFQFTHPGKGATRTAGKSRAARRVFQFTHPGKGATAKGTDL